MLYGLPKNTYSFAWNGSFLYYVNPDGKTLCKCAGDIKRADFGKQLSNTEY